MADTPDDRDKHEETFDGEEVEPVDEAHDVPVDGDALSQAEAIVNGAEAAAAEPSADSADAVLATERLADLQRLQAEYVNYRRRVERDRSVAREMAVNDVMTSLLPVFDDIDAARQHGDLAEGPFASIAAKMETVLAGHGLVRYGEVGADFDPTIHEALLQQPSPEATSETVSQVLRSGYKCGDRVLRAAQVAVAVPE